MLNKLKPKFELFQKLYLVSDETIKQFTITSISVQRKSKDVFTFLYAFNNGHSEIENKLFDNWFTSLSEAVEYFKKTYYS